MYGLGPVLLLGFTLSWLHLWWVRRALLKFVNVPSSMKLRKIHKFSSTSA